MVLGRYNPDNFLGGRMTLDAEAARTAMATVAEPMGMSEVEAAAGAVRIVESQMADLMRQMTLEQGLDPRDFVVYAYGGAGGAHAANFARELGCRTVVVPLGDLASTWSALGVMSSDVLHVYEQAQLMAAPFDADALNGVYDELEGRARAQLAEEGFTGDAVEIRRFADMKFNLQIHQVEVPVPGGTLGPSRGRGPGGPLRGALRADLRRRLGLHRRGRPGGRLPRLGARQGAHALAGAAPGRRAPRPRRRRATSTGTAWASPPTAIHRGEALGPGAEVTGPAIVEMAETTIVVPPGDSGTVDPYGSFVITIGEGAR